ncbi:cysteine dioxygenase family protein [Streptomyces sp. NPDC051940]|uniref:cysteine dioxygenase n=1 Tax=Streptomyces sp. NPDC051940 TaxID=3155675 RepID=UPI0034217733
MTATVSVLTPTLLADHVRRWARAPELWRGRVRFDAAQRWFTRLEQSAVHEVWLLSWLPGQGTEVHDHGGSSGAFGIVAGELAERAFGPRVIRPTPWGLPAGAIRAFGPRHVHEVANRATLPAVSIHAYSPPLTTMSYYRERPAGLLKTRTDAVEED